MKKSIIALAGLFAILGFFGASSANAAYSTVFASFSNSPGSIAVDPAGNIYVPTADHVITKLDSSGNTVQSWTSAHNSLGQIAVDNSGNIYVIAPLDEKLIKIDTSGVLHDNFATLGYSPNALITDPAGNVYVTSDDGYVQKITPAGVVSTYGATDPNPYAIARDSSGNIYTANIYPESVTKIALDGTSSIVKNWNVAYPNAQPLSIAVNSNGFIYVGCIDGTVLKISPTGTTTVVATEPQGVASIVVDSSNNVYAMDGADNVVYQITPGGSNTLFGSTGGNPAQLVIAPSGDLYTANSGDQSITRLSLIDTPPVFVSDPGLQRGVVGVPIQGNSITSTGGSTPSFSISPAITDPGLSFDTSTGMVSGTPTIPGDFTYTISTTNTVGTASQTFELQIDPAAPDFSITPNDVVLVKNSPVTSYSIVNNGGDSSTYTISPALPLGITFNTTTGLISGTPTVTSSSHTYTIAGTNITGRFSTTFTLIVNPAAPHISLSPTSISDALGSATSTYTVTNTGGAATFSVSPTLPSGLSVNASTGVLTGTPSSTSSSTTYTLTATNATGTSTATFNLLVNIALPHISLLPNSGTTYVGGPVFAYTIISTGGTIDSYSISPAPPSGVSFDTTTGLLSGSTNTTFNATVYTITATNISGSFSASYTLTSILQAPYFLISSSTETVSVNNPIVGYTLTQTGGPVASYTITPAAPSGLTFNTSTGLLSGTPTVPQAQTTYSIKGTNASGNFTLTYKLTVLPNAPNISLSSSSETTPAGQAITGYTINNSGGAVASYSISPSPYTGISFNTSTGLLSGTTSQVGTKNLTITATNAGGTSTATYTLTIGVALPLISLSSTSETTTAGHAIAGYTITSSGGAVDSYAISPAPSSGLSFNTTTGLLSGSTTSVGTQHFTITATNTSGTTTATYDLTVNVAAPAFTLSRSTETVVSGVAISGYTVTTTGGLIASYSISPAPSSGLSFNTSTGLLSGSTTSVGVQTFTITATNISGNATRTYALTVNPTAPSISLSRTSETVITGHAISGYTITNSGGAVANYSISPAPATGLSFNTSTGLLTGSSTRIGTQHFTITATNATATSTATYDLTVNIAAPSISLDQTAETVLAGSSITGYNITNTGGAATSYSISPSPSTGLSFDTTTGLLSGSTTTLGTQHFTITAINGTGTSTATYDLTVNVALPIISLSQTSESVVSGQSITGYTVTSSGGAVASYAISPTPTSGLSFNTSTGVLTGVTSTTGIQHFTITATNASGSATATYDLTVLVTAPNISLSSSSESITLGNTITGYTISNVGGAATNYSITPAVPSGLAFDTATGLLIGTPTTAGTTIFTIRATNVTGHSDATYQLTVSSSSAPSISLSSTSETIHIGSSITGYTITNTGGTINRFTIGPSAPAGLTFNTATGLLSGTPSNPRAATPFIITAIGPGGNSVATFTLTVIPDAPHITLSRSSETVTEGTSVVGYTITNTGGDPTLYSASPTLMDDLDVNPTTGAFTGRTFTTGDQVYTITASNAGGSSSATYTLHVLAIAPSISLTTTSENAEIGTPIQGYGILNGGDPATSFTISPAIADPGLTFDPTTGTISGTPTVIESQTYTITAINSGGSSSATYLLTVTVGVPVITLSSNYELVPFGQPIVGYTVSVTPNPADYFAISPAITDPGLSFDSTTGLLSGTPTISGETIYTITAVNTAGSSWDDYDLVVDIPAPAITIAPTSEQVIVGHGITGFVITNTGGDVDSYSISPALTDPGLTFNTNTGTLSGLPSVVSDTVYTITATNYVGSSNATFELNVVNRVPHISFSPATFTFILGQSVPTYTITNTGGPVVSYSITPAIATGLVFNTTTGVLSGTPTAVMNVTYTIVASNLGGNSSATLRVNVKPVAPSITLSSTSEVVVKNTPLVGYTITNTGGPIASYTLTGGGLPTGLIFNAATGVISGTPTVQLAATTFTITATNATASSSATFRLTVTPPQPVISLSSVSETAPYGSPINGYTINNGGGRALSYSISPAISNGLSFSTSTGLITGSPTSVAADVTYTITATNASGSSTATFDLTVVIPAPNISLSNTSETVVAGHAITGYTITNTGGPISSYSVSPAVSNGLSFDITTGLISGTPTSAASLVTYTITATNTTGTSTATYGITVNIVAPNISLSRSTETASVGTAIGGYTITNSGGIAASYSISPAIGNGLTFNTSTGLISGSPSAVASVVTYTITATNASGSSTATYAITVNVAVPHISLSQTSETVAAGHAITGYTITSTGGTVASYSISPAISNGLSFNTTNGLISGTPTAAASLLTYTITATNISGTSTATYGITINIAAPAISLSQTSETVSAGHAITGYTINSTGGTVANYSISPAIGNGLTFNTTTGLISGSPTIAASLATYTITATNISGTATATYGITVTVGAPNISLSATSETVVTGSNVVGYTINNSGGAATSYSISPAISLGGSLSFFTNSGLLSGFPIAQGTFTYTITATNGSGSSSATYTLTVIDRAPSISLSSTSENLVSGQLLAGYTITNTGGAVNSYSISPAPTTGLSFDTSTGLLTGHPRTVGTQRFTITATNGTGSSSATFDLTVRVSAPALTISTPSETVILGQAIVGYTLTNTGGAPTSYSITPAVATGLSFNTSTGLLTGTPTAVGSLSYTVTGTNGTGSSSVSYAITVAYPRPQISLSQSSELVEAGQSIAGYTITNTGGPITSYSVLPAVASGFVFNSSTGLISGSTLVPGVYSYTIRASNSTGNSSASYMINVSLTTPAITLSNPIETIQIGQAIAGYTISNTGGLISSYSISPAAPAGLTFNTSTGLISGTPLNPQVQTTYRITATNASGSSFRNYKLTVLPIVPHITLSRTSETVVSGQNIVGYTISNSGGSVDSYSISPGEADNLSFDTTTGLLTGSTTTVGLQSYTITATNAAGTSTATFNLTVVDAAPSIMLSQNSETVAAGHAITGYTITNTGGSITSYSISPAIGNGLSFDATTGLISGTPTSAASLVTYTITATNSTGSSSDTYGITVAVAAPAISLSRTTESVVAGHAISGFTITNTGGPIASYSISPAIGNGLSFSTATGLISGTPLSAASLVTYTITATNTSGSSTATYAITVSVSAPNISLSRTTESVVAGHAVSGYTITNTGGAVASYSISPTIGNGLSFNTSTGLISGNATAPATAVTYTITATNASGSSTATYTVTVAVAAPNISLSQTSESVTVGHAITGYTISNSGGSVASYSISPAIANGLTFSTLTGLISGTPSAVATVATYTITAINVTGSSTATYSITVTSAPVIPQAPAIALSSSGESVVSGTPIIGYTISNTGGSIASYSITPAANNGLSFNTTTGLLTGTPTDGATTKTFTITATNTGGTSTAVFTLTITAPIVQQPSIAVPAIHLSRTSESVIFGHSISGYTISNTGGTVASYSISPAVTNGLAFNTSTGLISGTTVNIASAVTYTITATNASGSSTATYTLTVTDVPPVAIAPQQSSITGMTPTSGTAGVATDVLVSGSFPQEITAISVNNVNLPFGSWTQTLSSISFTIPAKAAGKYIVQIYNNAAPVLAQQVFTFTVGSGTSTAGSSSQGGTKLTVTGPTSITPKPKSVPHYVYVQCVNSKGSVRIAYGPSPICPVGFVKK